MLYILVITPALVCWRIKPTSAWHFYVRTISVTVTQRLSCVAVDARPLLWSVCLSETDVALNTPRQLRLYRLCHREFIDDSASGRLRACKRVHVLAYHRKVEASRSWTPQPRRSTFIFLLWKRSWLGRRDAWKPAALTSGSAGKWSVRGSLWINITSYESSLLSVSKIALPQSREARPWGAKCKRQPSRWHAASVAAWEHHCRETNDVCHWLIGHKCIWARPGGPVDWEKMYSPSCVLKAFDNVNHFKLFTALCNSGILI